MEPNRAALFALFAALLLGMPHAEFTEYLRLQAFDEQYRPLEGVTMYVQYQLNAVDGAKKTKPKPTNSSGEVLLVFTNYEQIEGSTEYSYTAYAQYGNNTYTAGLIAGNTSAKEPRAYSFIVEGYYLVVRALDQYGAPLSLNVTIYSPVIANDSKTESTDSYGNAVFRVPPGEYDIKAEAVDFSKTETVVVGKGSGDLNAEMRIPLYTLDLRVMDDAGAPLSADVQVGERTAATDASGKARFFNITDPTPSLHVRTASGFKTEKLMLEKQSSIDIIFDSTKPVIKELYSTVSKTGAGTITLFAEDSGPKASGIESVAITYEIAGVSNPVSTYSVGYNSFEAKIPAQPPGTMVKYFVVVKDKDGNTATGTGSYSILKETPIVQVEPGKEPGLFAGLPFEGLAVAFVAFVVAVYAAVYYFNKKKEAEDTNEASNSPYKDSQPPSSQAKPPEVPPSAPKA